MHETFRQLALVLDLKVLISSCVPGLVERGLLLF